jgi:hypothetical protein
MTDIDYEKLLIPSHRVLWTEEDKCTGGVTVCIDIKKIVDNLLDQNNKAWLKRVEGLKIKKQIGGSFIREGYNFAVKDINTSIDNLINKYKQL